MSKYNKGFTLIELLVVIAIIGILSSVVLASLSVARGKGNDAKVEAQLSSLRASAEVYNDTNKSYGGTQTDCHSGMFADTVSGMSQYTATANYPAGALMICNSTNTAYAVSAILPGNGGGTDAWCVDSLGNSIRETGGNIGSGVIQCPL
jgi:prepilin-type N-terminal cleavage/methylation domain-containing protein